ncbi:MAG: hypothetical protein HYT99_04640 [Candidatus Tectomicrobia bacterium]|nr:hypothetical protein [Candidatus Tectomicrobia bacterium]
MEGRSKLAACAGFVLWAGLAYFYYVRDLGGAIVLALLFAGWAALYGWMRRRPPRPPRPKSDLPRFKFDDVKPKDFE